MLLNLKSLTFFTVVSVVLADLSGIDPKNIHPDGCNIPGEYVTAYEESGFLLALVSQRPHT